MQLPKRGHDHQQSHGDPGKARDAVRAGPVLLARKRPRQLDAHGAVPPELRQVVAEDEKQQSHEHRRHGTDVHLIAQSRAERERSAEQRDCRTEPQHHRPQHRIHILPLCVAALSVGADEMQRQNKQRQAEHRHTARCPAVRRSIEAPMRRHRLRQARVENGARQQRQQADRRGQQQLFFVCLHGSFSPFKSCNHSSTSSKTEALRL